MLIVGFFIRFQKGDENGKLSGVDRGDPKRDRSHNERWTEITA